MRRPRAFCSSFVIVLAVLLSGTPGKAQDSRTKRELAVELLQAAGGGEMAQQISQIMLTSMRQSYSSMVQQLIASQPSLTEDQRVAVERHLSDFDRFAKKFNSRLLQKVDFNQMLEEIYVPLYEKYFTEAELRQILAFQTSAVGRKATSIMPQLMQEGMAATLPRLQSAVVPLTKEVLMEEQAIALQQLP